MRIALSGIMLAGLAAGGATAAVVVDSGTLYYEEDSGGYYDEAVSASGHTYWGNMVSVDWSGTNSDPLRFEGWGGDTYESHDGSDGSWEYMQYGYCYIDLIVTFNNDTLLTGGGDMGFRLEDLNSGTTWQAPLDAIAGGFVVAAGQYQLRVDDYGYGVADGGSSEWSDDDTGEFAYDSWSSYYYSGWVEITEVPAPGALALLALAGACRRRRRH